MATPGVGQDIEALCGKCGQVWHVVMAKMGDRIAKVVCKRCGGHHRYRLEADAAAPNPPATGAAASGERKAAPRRTARAHAAPPAPVIPAFDPAKPPRPYGASQL